MWTAYNVHWTFLDSLCASVPANPLLVDGWINARKPKVRPPGGKSIDEIQEEVFSTLQTEAQEAQEPEERSLLVFQRRGGFIYERAATFRAHLKECARTVATLHIGKIEGEKSFSTRFINAVYHDPAQYWVPILDASGQPIKALPIADLTADSSPTFTVDKAVHARGPRGIPIHALKSFESVYRPQVTFRLLVMTARSEKAKPIISQADLETVMSYGMVHGYGGERGDGEGRYTFTVTADTAPVSVAGLPAVEG